MSASQPRLQAVSESEEPAASAGSSGGGNGGSIEERLVKLETHVQYLATKEDIQKLKVWVLGGVVGGMVLAVTITLAIARIWS